MYVFSIHSASVLYKLIPWTTCNTFLEMLKCVINVIKNKIASMAILWAGFKKSSCQHKMRYQGTKSDNFTN